MEALNIPISAEVSITIGDTAGRIESFVPPIIKVGEELGSEGRTIKICLAVVAIDDAVQVEVPGCSNHGYNPSGEVESKRFRDSSKFLFC
jgi:hypothetical protein